MPEPNGGSTTRASNMDVLNGLQRLELMMVERFTKLETSGVYLSERLAKIETQYEQVRDTLKSIETSQAATGVGLKEVQKTTADLERDVTIKQADIEQRIRALEKGLWKRDGMFAALAVVASLVIERIIIPLVLR